LEVKGAPLNILILTSMRINSGSGFRVSAIAKYLAKRGYNVALTAIGEPCDKDNTLKRYVAIPDLVFFAVLVPLVFIVNLITAACFRPHLIIASKPLPSSFLPAWIIARFTGVKVVLDFDDLEHGYWSGSFFSGLLRAFESFAIQKADIITTHSMDLSEYLTSKCSVCERKIWYLAQGIDNELFSMADDTIRKSLGLTDKIVLVYAAHFNIASRDFTVILDTIARLKKTVSNVVLLAIGDGPMFKSYEQYALEAGIKDNVIFMGYVPHSKIGSYFAAGDIALSYLRPTHANRCRASIKLREYLLCGLAVVCNDIGRDLDQFRPT
jgi:glycosyltransferase involved in cell wall biosynthesis